MNEELSGVIVKITPITLGGKHVRLEPLTFAHEAALNDAAADGELSNTDVTIIPKGDGMNEYIQFALDGLSQGTQLPFIRIACADRQGCSSCFLPVDFFRQRAPD